MKRTLYLLISAMLITSCGNDTTPTKAPSPPKGPLTWPEAVTLNNRAVALMDQQRISKATELFKELTERAPDAPEGWVNLGIALFNSQKNDAAEKAAAFARCQACLERAMTMLPDDAHAPYTLAILEDHRGTAEGRVRALELLEQAHSLAPADPSIAYRLGIAKRDAGHLEEAVKFLKRATALAPHFSSAWYGLMQAFARQQRIPERTLAFERYQALEDHAVPLFEKIELKYNFMGSHANVMRNVAPFGEAVASAQPAINLALTVSTDSLGDIPTPTKGHALPHGLTLAKGAAVRAFIEETIVPRLAPGVAIHNTDADDFLEIYVADGKTVGHIYDRRNGKLVDITNETGLSADIRSIGGIFGDVNHDGHPDLFIFGAGRDALFLNNGKGAFKRDTTIKTQDQVTLSASIADLDHDGDLDILTAGYLELPDAGTNASADMTFPDDFSGAPNHLFNNNRPTVFNSTEGDPSFTDISNQTIAQEMAERTAGITSLDADRDGDLDLFFANDGGSNHLLLNDRIWRYRKVSAKWGLNDSGPALYTQTLDANQDGWPDLLLGRGPQAATLLLMNNNGLTFSPRAAWLGASDEWVSQALMTPIDLDLDGDTDLFAINPDGEEIATLRNNGSATFTVSMQSLLPADAQMRGAIAHDFSGDGHIDFALAAQGGGVLLLQNSTKTPNNGLHIALQGKREDSMAPVWSNHFGLGARMEVAAGPRRMYVDRQSNGSYLSGASPHLVIGIREAKQADYARVLWPDLVLQNEIDLVVEKKHTYSEANRKPSSCPVLFVGRPDGSGYEFVADFLGVGGLGFFIEPGVYAKPDPTEMVRIGSMAPHKGTYRMRIAEPMEEVCYLDQLSLVFADHPVGTVVHADERLATAAPWPSGDLLCFKNRHHPTHALGTDGSVATDALRHTDREYARGLQLDRRFVGYLATEQAVTLTFDMRSILADRPSPSSKLYLCVNGWTEYPYSHVNFAAWQAGVRGQSISLDTRSSAGGWQTAMTEFGYPAGLSRTMAVEVTSAFSVDDFSWRLRTNLEVSFDEIFLAWHMGEGALRVHEVAFDTASLFHLGYPREHSLDGRLPKIYDHDIIDPHIEWKSMKGRFTAFGNVQDLLLHPQDDPVIFGHGEAIDLTLQANKLLLLKEGHTRTFFLKANGYCKDMDPYTAFPESVDPLPFHAMKNYPPTSPDKRERSTRGRERLASPATPR